MSARLMACVVYGDERVLDFYRALGVEFVQEKHETGPVHHAAAVAGEAVFEVYPPTTVGAVDRVQLIFEVDDLDEVALRLAGQGVRFVNWTQGAARARTHDPLGRPVLLVQKSQRGNVS